MSWWFLGPLPILLDSNLVEEDTKEDERRKRHIKGRGTSNCDAAWGNGGKER